MSGRSIISDLLLAGAGIGALVLGEIPLFGLMIVLTILATGEVLRLARAGGVAPVALLGLAGAVALLGVAQAYGEDATIYFPMVLVSVVTLSFLVMMTRAERPAATEAVAFTLVPLLAVGLLAAYVVALRSAREGFRIVLALALMAIVNDLVSGAVDPRRGKRVIAPALRPSRTYEGLAAGALATMAVAVVVAVTLGETFSWGTALLLGALVSVAAPLGDLSRAMFERDLRVEIGAPLPRARVWRRIDGLLFAAPVFFYAFRMLER